MSFRLKEGEFLSHGIKRVIGEEADEVLAQLHLASTNTRKRDDAIHEARKGLKKIRAILRLVRNQIGDKIFRSENIRLRDVSRKISELRDAQVLIDLLKMLYEQNRKTISITDYHTLLTQLLTHRKIIKQNIFIKTNSVQLAIKEIKAFKSRNKKWPALSDRWSTRNEDLKRIYRQGYNALSRVRQSLTVETLHELRKQAKYLRYQLEFLECLWPNLLTVLVQEFHELTNLLGEHHDLIVLRGAIENEAPKRLLKLIDKRRKQLEQKAKPFAKRLYAEKPERFTERLQKYWKER